MWSARLELQTCNFCSELTFSIAIIPAAATKESVRVDFPAQTLAVLSHAAPLGHCSFAQPQKVLPTVVHMRNNTHVTDVLGQVHKSTDLLDGELHHTACAALTAALSRNATTEHGTTKPPPEDCKEA